MPDEDLPPPEIWVQFFTDARGFRFGFGEFYVEFKPTERGGAEIIVPRSGQHMTITCDVNAGRLGAHHTIEHELKNINGVPVMVFTRHRIERLIADSRFLSEARDRVLRSLQFLTHPRQLSAAGVLSVVPCPTAQDWVFTSDARFAIQIAKFMPLPVDAPWCSPPGSAFLAFGQGSHQSGLVLTSVEGPRKPVAFLSVYRAALLADWFPRMLSEPSSPPLAFGRELLRSGLTA